MLYSIFGWQVSERPWSTQSLSPPLGQTLAFQRHVLFQSVVYFRLFFSISSQFAPPVRIHVVSAVVVLSGHVRDVAPTTTERATADNDELTVRVFLGRTDAQLKKQEWQTWHQNPHLANAEIIN